MQWPKLGTCFVTGGSGFLGRTLIQFLRDTGISDDVWALVRSDAAADAATKAGATKVIRGDLSSKTSVLTEAMKGCDYCFHLAAEVSPWWGFYDRSYEANVMGTTRMIDACTAAGVKRLIHCSTEATLVAGPGGQLRNATETFPYGNATKVYPYTATKAEAERRVVATGKSGGALETVVCRPRFIWGIGDTVILARMVTAVNEGSWSWFNGGRYLTSTCHVRNVCEGMVLAASKGTSGSIYFLTDGQPIQFREFITLLLATQGVKPPNRSISNGVAMAASVTLEYLWWIFGCCCRRGSEPPICRQVVKLIGEEVTVDDSKARKELGYTAHVSRDRGIDELKQQKEPPANGRLP